MKKILFITQKRDDAIWIVDLNLKAELWRLSHNFEFFELKEKGNTRFIIILHYFQNIISLLWRVKNYDKLYFSWENPYVIFVHFFFPKKKIYLCVHHVEDYWWKSTIGKLIIKSVYRFIVVSNFTKNQLVGIWAKIGDIFVNYNWVSDGYFPEKIIDFEYKNYILYVGTESERKNIKILLKSFELVLKKFPNTKLLKIWIAWYKKEQEENDKYIEKLWIKNNVIFLRKKLPLNDLRKFYSNAICYVSVAKLEWFGLTVPEAMKCACPVVISNILPFLEIVWNSQIVVDTNNIEEISTWIMKYIEDNKFRDRMSKEWLEITKKFTWENNVNNLIKILS
jgi:glycosyltransferase involved in cell wall biosynthesis